MPVAQKARKKALESLTASSDKATAQVLRLLAEAHDELTPNGMLKHG